MGIKLRPGIWIILVITGIVTGLAGCVKRPNIVATENTTSPPPTQQTGPPPPSPILRKKKPGTSDGIGLSWNLGRFDLPAQQQPSANRLDSINDYFYSNCSVKPQTLTGMEKVLSDTWDVAKYGLAGVAFAGWLAAQNKKK